jgi:hypothetical protein
MLCAEEKAGNLNDGVYGHYLKAIQERFDSNVQADVPLFKTDADLWELYLDSFPENERQYHNCHACKEFIVKFGSLATIDEEGTIRSPIWSQYDAPADTVKAAIKMRRAVEKAKITGVFLSSVSKWGTSITGIWRHFAITPPRDILHEPCLMTAGQAMAEKLQDYITLRRALAEVKLSTLEVAVAIVDSETLYRSEKVTGAAKWLRDLKKASAEYRDKRRDNIIWRAVATSPAGFCHPRSSMIGTLLEDLASDMPYDLVARRFKDKMHPLQYQRPQSAPSLGNIEQAEKVVEKMGIANSLKRRYAKVEEIEAIWRPKEPENNQSGGIFDHLKNSEEKEINLPAKRMTWKKFEAEVLPKAERIKYWAPRRREGFYAIVTAADQDAPPIIQWDKDECRNPFSCYTWTGGRLPSHWGLIDGSWNDITAVTLRPSMWYDGDYKNQANGVLFIIEGAKESNTTGGLALFPEILKKEFHSIRKTIEAFSKKGQIEGVAESSACGLGLNKGDNWDAAFKVYTGKLVSKYILDRWD